MTYKSLLATVLASVLVVSCTRTEKHTEAPKPSEADAHLTSAAASNPAGESAHGHGHGSADHEEAHGHGGKGPIGHRFEKAEQWVSVFDDPERNAWQKPDEVVALMGLHPGHTVADIGAGTGYFLPHLSKAVGTGGSVVGVDIEADMVRHMRERAEREGLPNVRVRQGRPDDAALHPATMDRILIVNTWHHIPNRPAYARKLRDALRPRGRVYVVDYTLDSPQGPPKAHRLPPERVIEELKAGGLDANLAEESLPLQYVVVGQK